MILALLPLLAAAAEISPVPPAPAAPLPVATDDPDLRCMIAVSFALGAASEKGADAETIGGMTAVFMYFLGKVDAAHPGEDLGRAFRRVVGQRGYERELSSDLARCGAEAEARGAMLKNLGEQLKDSVPLAPSSAG